MIASPAVASHRCPVAVHQEPSPFQRLARRIAARLSPELQAGFIAAVNKATAQVSEGALRAAIAGGNLSRIEDLSGARSLVNLLEQEADLDAIFHRSATLSGTGATDILEEITGLGSTFNARDPRVIQYAREQTAGLVVDVDDSVKQAIRFVTSAGADLGLTTGQQARLIRETVGLPPNWAMAPSNLESEILGGQTSAATGRRLSAADKQQIRSRISRGTVTEKFASDMRDRYQQSLINRRAQNIARTETLRAAHAGQRMSWQQAIEQGALPKNTRRFWVVTADERLSFEHAQIPGMNMNGRKMDEPFDTPEGAFMDPPIRPNCRCGTSIFFPGVEEPSPA